MEHKTDLDTISETPISTSTDTVQNNDLPDSTDGEAESKNAPNEPKEAEASKRKHDFANVDIEEPSLKKMIPSLEGLGQILITATMECPSVKAGTIIGRKGVHVNEIMKRTNCRVRVEQESFDGVNRKVTFTGPAEGLAMAMALVQLLVKDGPTVLAPALSSTDEADEVADHIQAKSPKASAEPLASTQSSQTGSGSSSTQPAPYDPDSVICPHSKVAIVIGSKGAIVQEILRRTGCRVHVMQDGVPDGADRVVQFFGTDSQVEVAKALVRDIIAEGPQVLNKVPSLGSPPPLVKEEVDIPPDRVGAVIGSKGAVIADIMRRSNCKIIINQDFPEGQMHKVVYTGTHSQIGVAKELVDLVVRKGAAALTQLDNERHLMDNMFHDHEYFGGPPGPGPGYGPPHQAWPAHDPHPRHHAYHPGVEHSGPYGVGRDSPRGPPHYSAHGAPHDPHGAPHGFPSGSGAPVGGFGHQGQQYASGPPASFPGSHPSAHPHGHQPQHAPQPQHAGAAKKFVPGTFSLGAEGKAGLLEPPTPLGDGLHQQIAEINFDFVGKIIGKGGSTLALIVAKSGSRVQMIQGDDGAAGSAMRTPSKVVLVGSPNAVALASQMLQEVLVNGTTKIQGMASVPLTVPSGYPLLPDPAHQPQHGQSLATSHVPGGGVPSSHQHLRQSSSHPQMHSIHSHTATGQLGAFPQVAGPGSTSKAYSAADGSYVPPHLTAYSPYPPSTSTGAHAYSTMFR